MGKPISPTSRRAVAKIATREKLAATAREMFSRLGYEATTLREIAKTAGMTTGAVFAHWPDKAALYRDLYGHAPVNPETGAGLLNLVRRFAAGEGAVDVEMAKALVAQAMEA